MRGGWGQKHGGCGQTARRWGQMGGGWSNKSILSGGLQSGGWGGNYP